MDTDNKDIDFVASRYMKGKFSVKDGWARLGISPQTAWWKRTRVAAAIGGFIFLSAAAAVVYHQYSFRSDNEIELPQPTEDIAPAFVVKAIDFENIALPIVVERIKEVYNVDVVNIPENADALNLSLHYEGNAFDLVDTINEILGTQMSVRER